MIATIIIATRNQHKVEEIHSILGGDFKCLSIRDFPGAPPVVEDASTFSGNATLKAVALARWLSKGGAPSLNRACVLADDSGLEVDALNGAPGVNSARFAALDSGTQGNSPDAENNRKLLHLLQHVPAEKRTARFRCVLVLCPLSEPGPETSSPVCYADEFETAIELFDGTCEGRIAFAPSGSGGFGYDPLFIPEGHSQSFAELGEAVKNALSHRSKALAKLKSRLKPAK